MFIYSVMQDDEVNFIIILSTHCYTCNFANTSYFQKQAFCSKALINKFTENAGRNMKEEC